MIQVFFCIITTKKRTLLFVFYQSMFLANNSNSGSSFCTIYPVLDEIVLNVASEDFRSLPASVWVLNRPRTLSGLDPAI